MPAAPARPAAPVTGRVAVLAGTYRTGRRVARLGCGHSPARSPPSAGAVRGFATRTPAASAPLPAELSRHELALPGEGWKVDSRSAPGRTTALLAARSLLGLCRPRLPAVSDI